MVPHRIIRARGNHGREIDTLCLIAGADVCRRSPGWISALVGDGGHHGRRERIASQLADADRVDGYFIFPRRVIVKTQLGEVYHNPLTRRVRQDGLQRNRQYAARPGHIGIYARVGLQQRQEPDVIFFSNRFQRTAIVFNHVKAVFTYDVAAGGRKRPGIGASRERDGNRRGQRNQS